jgi:SAM-dependent methyltransferase
MTTAVPRGRSFDAWADDYDRYRPTYPDALFERIVRELTLSDQPSVVDLGAGTGRASIAMAALGWRVTAVEPGGPMLEVLRARAAAADLEVVATQAAAESTGLDPASFDLATAAQAFHWFDKPAALAEMARIVRPGGGIALFWNVREETRSPFVADYHELLERYGGVADGKYLQAGRATGRSAKASTDGSSVTTDEGGSTSGAAGSGAGAGGATGSAAVVIGLVSSTLNSPVSELTVNEPRVHPRLGNRHRAALRGGSHRSGDRDGNPEDRSHETA